MDATHRSETPTDTNDRIWKSDELVREWAARDGERAAKRAAQWTLMARLLPFAEEDRFIVADLGAGTGAAARAVLATYPNSRAVLADFSPQMREEGIRTMAEFAGRFDYVAFDLMETAWPDGIPRRLDAVVTSQCIHHLPDSRKASLFAEILGRLTPGGWYLNFDPITTDDPAVAEAWRRAAEREDPHAAQAGAHRTPEEQERHDNHVRHLAPLDRQLGALRAAGFEAIDVFWKHLDMVIYGGRRP
jgi:SAM-dependent methyltransferase